MPVLSMLLSIPLSIAFLLAVPIDSTDENRCRYSDYFYGVVQAEVTCDPACGDPTREDRCSACALNALCGSDPGASEATTANPCNLIVLVQTAEHNRTRARGKRPWRLESWKNPASNIGTPWIGDQYIYQVHDTVDQLPDPDCFKLLVTVSHILNMFPYDEAGLKRLAFKEVELPLPTKAQLQNHPKMKPETLKVNLSTDAVCHGHNGLQYPIGIRVDIVYFVREISLNDGTTGIYDKNQEWMNEHCVEDCRNPEYVYITQKTRTAVRQLTCAAGSFTCQHLKRVCYGGQLEGFYHPQDWRCRPPM